MKGSPSRGEGRKAAIAEVALRVFLERGFDVSVDDIAAAAGASKQTIYKFFDGRPGLVRAALALELERVVGPMRDAATRPGEPRERLSEFARAYQAVLFSDECLAMYRYVIGHAQTDADLGVAFNGLIVDYVLSLVTPVISEATGAAPRDADALASGFVGALQGSELNRALAGMPANPDRLIALRDHALHMLAD